MRVGAGAGQADEPFLAVHLQAARRGVLVVAAHGIGNIAGLYAVFMQRARVEQHLQFGIVQRGAVDAVDAFQLLEVLLDAFRMNAQVLVRGG